MDGEKLANLGTVNSAEQRKPKYARQQAAQNKQIIRNIEIQSFENNNHDIVCNR